MTRSADDQYAYVRVANALRQSFRVRGLEPGARVDSIRAAAKEHKVTEVTARQAFRLLVDEGLLRPDSTRGYFMADGTEERKKAPEPSPEFAALTSELTELRKQLQRLDDRVQDLEALVNRPRSE